MTISKEDADRAEDLFNELFGHLCLPMPTEYEIALDSGQFTEEELASLVDQGFLYKPEPC